MHTDVLLLFVGLVLLVKGADLLVDGAAALAYRLGLSLFTIGLTVVAFGTSLPELVVNVQAGIQNKGSLAMGNILGSNISNVLLAIGISACFVNLPADKRFVYKDLLAGFAAILLLFVLTFFQEHAIASPAAVFLSRRHGIILLILFAAYMYITLRYDRAGLIADARKSTAVAAALSPFKSVVCICCGLAGLIIGGRWIVAGALALTKIFGLSEGFIGLTVIAIGTSLPEIATSAVAAYKKQTDLAVANIFGSNIFNILFILGVSAVLRPVGFDVILYQDMIINIGICLIVYLFTFTGKRYVLDRWEGRVLVLLYPIYLIYLFKR